MFNKKIAQSFARWSKKAQKLPANNEAIKQTVLDNLRPTMSEVKVRRPFKLGWIFMTLVPALVILLVVRQNIKTNTQVAYLEDPGYGAPAAFQQSASYDTSGAESFGTANMTGLAKQETMVGRIMESIPDIMPIYYHQTPDITDTREFLKTSFGLNINTRKVDKTYTRIKTVIRGYDGRIDNSSLNAKYARLSFVIPKSSYDSFIEEVQGMFPEKFIKLSENTSNLLGQKQNIEENTNQSNLNLADFRKNRENAVKTHDASAASLQKEINRLNGIIYSLNQQKKTVSSTDQAGLKKINDQISYYTHSLTAQKKSLEQENINYQNTLDGLDRLINAEEKQLANLEKQDTKLINNVETVDGTITIKWISLFEIVNLYIPVYKTIIVVCILIILFYIFAGRKPKEIELP